MFFVVDILPTEQIDWFRKINSPHVIDFIRCLAPQVDGMTAVRKIAALCEEFGVRAARREGGDNDR